MKRFLNHIHHYINDNAVACHFVKLGVGYKLLAFLVLRFREFPDAVVVHPHKTEALCRRELPDAETLADVFPPAVSAVRQSLSL